MSVCNSIIYAMSCRLSVTLTIVTVCCGALFFPADAGAIQRLSIYPDFTNQGLGNFIETYEDVKGELGIMDVISERYSSLFKQSHSSYPTFGFTTSSYWARFSVVNMGTGDSSCYLDFTYPQLDDIRVYRLDASGTILERYSGGDGRPYGEREIDFKNVVFKINLPAGADQQIYVRIKTKSSMNLHMALRSAGSFAHYKNSIQIAIGFFCGAILIMQLYTLFLFFSTGEKSFFWYIMYYMSFLMLQLTLSGAAYQMLWPNAVWWNSCSLPFLTMLCSLLALMFWKNFLEISKNIQALDRWVAPGIVLLAIVLPFTLIVDYRISIRAALVTALAVVMIIVVSTAVLIARGLRPARFYLLAWGSFLIGTALYTLRYFSIVPDNMLTILGQQGASLVEIVLISFGLADRINVMKHELLALNVNLEKRISERTKEIQLTLEAMKEKDFVLQQELDLASNIQQGIIPQGPHYYEGVKIETFYQSMGKVGGDFYDFFQMMGGHLGVLIGDVSGHGVPAAFITALAKISFAEAIRKYLEPRDIFSHVNSALVDAIKTDDFVTAFFMVINHNFEVSYCNASHTRALVLRKNEMLIEAWDTNGLFMGSMLEANAMYKDGHDRLYFGDRLLLYTDGITESSNQENKIFGETRLRGIFLETADLPIEQVRMTILSRWREYLDGKPPLDDTAFILVEIDPCYEDLIRYRERGFKLVADHRYPEAIEEFQKALQVNPNDVRCNLSLGESYFKIGNYVSSIDYYARYLDRNEADADAWYRQAQAYFYIDYFEMTIQSAERAVRLRKHFVDALILIGLSYKSLKNVDAATRIWIRILIMDPQNRRVREEMEKITEDV